METQNHQKVIQSGHEEHSGVHVCHKCEWPFPNQHPSSRHRRAHKKVCGTIEGYKLDVSQDKSKTHVDGSDNDHVSDDDHKISSDKVIERTISRKSSSGFGSRSSRSTRSEDEVFADAVTEFGEGSDGMSRGNSLQYTSESGPEGSELNLENAIDDDASTTSIVLEDKQLRVVQTFEGNNDEAKAGIPSEDQSSIGNPALICASVTRENEDAVEHNLKHSSGSSEDDVSKEIAKKDNLSELETPNSETAEASEQVSDLNDRNEFPHRVDSPGNSNPSSNSIWEVDFPDGNLSKSFDVAEEHEPKSEANGNTDRLDVSNAFPLQVNHEIADEDLDHKEGKINISISREAPSATEDVHKQKDRPAKPVVQQETVGGLDQISVLKAPYGGLQSEEALEDIRDEVWEDQEVSDSDNEKSMVSSEKASPEASTTPSVHDQETSTNGRGNAIDAVKDDGEILDIHENNSSKVAVGELSVTNSTLAECSVDYITPQYEKLMNAIGSNGVCDAEKVRVNEITVSISEVNDQEVSSGKEQKSTVSLGKEFPEVATTDGVFYQGRSAYGSAKAIDVVKGDGEYVVTRENDSIGVNEMKVGLQDENEPVSAVTTESGEDTDRVFDQGTSAYGDAKAIDVVKGDGDYVVTRENDSVRVNEMAVGLEDENKPVSAETIESSEDNDEPIKSASTHDHSMFYKVLDSGNLMVDHSLQGIGPTPQGLLRKAQNADEIIGGEECTDEVDTGGVGKTNDVIASSTTVLGSCSEEFVEHASDVTASDRMTNQRIAVSPAVDDIHLRELAVDDIHLSELTESQEMNSHSFSVPSATLDAFPVTKNDAPSTSQVSVGPEVEPKATEEVQHCESKTYVEPLGLEKSEFTCEIEASENQRQTALKTLLGEAIAKSRAESPDYDELPMINPKAKETGKEWDSPARYPVKIKTEKKRAKGRSSYWVPFLCCSSSVNANGP